jgi:hypothetical protein
MPLASHRQAPSKPIEAGAGAGQLSRGLEWLWQQLQDVRQPHVLDCGRMRPPTMQVLLHRGAKIYVADLLSPLRNGAPNLWVRAEKTPVFQLQELLRQVPEIPEESLAAVFCWQLLDLVPHTALAELIARLVLYLRPGGVLFCQVREPYLPQGAETEWWLETLTTLGRSGDGKLAFTYPPITNRQMESLLPSASVKTFLTRAGLREVLVLR